MKRVTLLFLVVMLGGLLFLGAGLCSAQEVQRGGVLRFEYDWIPYVKDPAADGVGTGNVAKNIAETLTWGYDQYQPHGLLCEKWEASPDGKEWTLYLRKGVTFNNGKPFTADDVVWNFLHWLDPATGSSMRDRLSMLSPEGVEKVDDYTVKLHLDRPFYGIPWVLSAYPAMIAPEGGWKDFYSGNPEDAIGTGPFLLKEFIPNERMVLVRRDDYWRMGVDGKPLPYVDEVVITPFADDAARLAALVGDELDIIPGAVGEGIIGELRKHPDIVVATIDLPWSSPIMMRCDVEPFNNPLVRKAFKLVVDREKLRDLCMPEGRLAYDHWVHPMHEGYCPCTDMYYGKQDIEKAKELLAQAGYPDGLEVDLYTPNSPAHRPALAQAYAEMAALAGIKVNVKILPSSVFWDKWMTWPFSVSGWSGRPLATDNISLGCRCGAAWNEMYWCNEEFDRLLDEIEGTVDVQKRRELLCVAQRIMQEDSGMILPFWNVDYMAYRKEVHGYSYVPMMFATVWLSSP